MDTGRIEFNPSALVDSIADAHKELRALRVEVAGLHLAVVAALIGLTALYVLRGRP